MGLTMHNINIGTWVPACGGTEQPFVTRSGVKVQYLWNNVTGEHRYINCDNDILIPDNELSLVFGE
mgnify:CR=1 FL=1